MKQTSPFSSVVVALPLLAIAPVAATALTVNFDVPGGTAAGAQNYSGPGAAPDPGVYWNPAPIGTSAAALASDGTTVTPITFTNNSGTFCCGNGAANGTPDALFAPFDHVPATTTLTLNNVPAGTYDLYLYGINGSFNDNRGTLFTAQTSLTPTITAATLNSPGGDGSFILGGNYVEIPAVAVGGDGTINLTYAPNPAAPNGGEGDFNGLQLVSAVPEPSTWIPASGLLLLAAGDFRRRLRA